MAVKGDYLIGNIALKEGLISRDQLYDCLMMQERNPSKSLGSLLVQRSYIDEEDLRRLLAKQEEAFRQSDDGPAENRGCAVLGRLLVEKGLATEFQINECLRLQGRLAEMGIQPVPLLGEILVKRGYVKREAIERALQLQNMAIYRCPECGADIAIENLKPGSETYRCSSCATEIPFLFARMAAEIQSALDKSPQELEAELPHEARVAAQEPDNHFGKYILVKRVGKGGTGAVYKAWQKDMNKYVALKRLLHHSGTGDGVKTPFGDAEDVKRFYNEVHAAAGLSHPNIVPIHDIGWNEDNFFFTMQYIDGTTLARLVNEGADESMFKTTIVGKESSRLQRYQEERTARKGKGLPIPQTMEIVRQVADAIQYAHARGVFHRDLKPHNVLIDDDGKPWVMDFGLAKEVRVGDSAYVRGIVVGTPPYMPPEQAEGDMEKVDHLSDIYSLGAVLYEMLTGKAPFSGESNTEILRKVMRGDFVPPRKIDPEIPVDAERICLKAMQRERSRRYGSASEFLEDVDCFVAGRPLKNAVRRGLLGRIFRG